MSAKEQFDQSEDGESRKRAARQDSGVIPGVPPLQNLIVPSKSSVGARLLKAMGWREGEGVGPKVVKYQPQQGRVRQISVEVPLVTNTVCTFQLLPVKHKRRA